MKKYLITIGVLFLAAFGLLFFLKSESQDNETADPVISNDRKELPEDPEQNAESDSQDESSKSSIETLWEKGNFPERLQVAGLDLPLIFEGPISEELKQVILADMDLVQGHATGYELYELPSEISYQIPNRNVPVVAHHGIAFSGLRVARPEVYHNMSGHIVEIEGRDHVIMPEELIAAYEDAWAKREADPEKYESLESFIDWLNAAPLEELKADNPYWLYGYDGVSVESPLKAEEIRNRLLPAQREDLRVGHPSILEFTYVDQKALEEQGAVGQLPEGVTLADGKYLNQDGIPYQQALFLYDGAKWHIAFAKVGH